MSHHYCIRFKIHIFFVFKNTVHHRAYRDVYPVGILCNGYLCGKGKIGGGGLRACSYYRQVYRGCL